MGRRRFVGTGGERDTRVALGPDAHEHLGTTGPRAAGSFLAERGVGHWFAGEPVRPGDSVSDTIVRFSPADVPPAQWARIGPVVRSAVEQAAPTTVYEAGTLLSTVTQLAIWADTLGQPIEPGALFHPDLLDRFATEGCAHLRPGTRLNYRRHLRAVGAAVLGPGIYPPRPLPLYRPDPLAPYSPAEVTALWSWCRGLPTERFRDNAMGIVALGLGVGLTSQEMSRLVGSDVVADAEGVVVDVIGKTGRSVPVVERWAEVVHDRAAEVGARPFLFPERTRISRHQLPNFIERCASGDAPELNTIRLRITWIVNQLSAGTHVSVVADAAGVAAAQVVKYLPYAEHPDSAEARRQLRQALE